MGLMKEKVGEPELLCQCAEECAEMAQAALKLARILRAINPTPISEEEARQNLKEEFSDIANCADDLGLQVDRDLIRSKQERFLKRWREMK